MNSLLRTAAATVAASFVALATTNIAYAAGSPADLAKADLVKAEAALVARKYDESLTSFLSIFAAAPSARAADGLAKSLEAKARFGEAYERYGDVLGRFAAEATPAQKLFAQRRKTELEGKTANLTVSSNEGGASVEVEGVLRGTTPLAGPLRCNLGATVVKLSKPGFVTSESVPNVIAGGVRAEFTLVSQQAAKPSVETAAPRLRVEEKSGQAVRVFIDGVDKGEAPWEGEIALGEHEVNVRGAGMQSSPVRIKATPGPKSLVIAEALAQTGLVRIEVEGGRGEITLDGSSCGQGRCAKPFAIGNHKLRVELAGYEPFEREFSLAMAETFSLNVQLTLIKIVTTEKSTTEARGLRGTYLGFALLGSPIASAQGSTFDDAARCARVLGAKSCESSAPLAAGVSAVIGYHWDPIGLEVMLSGQYDVGRAKARYEPGVPGANPLAIGPARTEDFTMRRGGVTLAARARISTQGKRLRLSFAAGPGLSVRYAWLQREALADDGRRDNFSSSAESAPYIAPALSTEVQLGIRVSETTAITFSTFLQAEHAAYSDLASARSKSSTDRLMFAPNQPPTPISTPAYQIAAGGQWQLGFTAGIMFGP